MKASGPEALAAATEWEVCRNALAAAPSYFVVNGEEGRCGRFTDRHLMEGDPQRVLEGLLIAAYGRERTGPSSTSTDLRVSLSTGWLEPWPRLKQRA